MKPRKQISPGKFQRMLRMKGKMYLEFRPTGASQGTYVHISSKEAIRKAKKLHTAHLFQMAAIGEDPTIFYSDMFKVMVGNFMYFYSDGKYYRRELKPVTSWRLA